MSGHSEVEVLSGLFVQLIGNDQLRKAGPLRVCSKSSSLYLG